MLTLADITFAIARIVNPENIATGSATAGTTTSITDTANLTQDQAYFDRGTLWILSGTHAGKVLSITSHNGNKVSFAALGSAPSAGDRFAVCRAAYPWQQLKSAVSIALSDERAYIEAEDATLDGDGDTLEFTLPSGVFNLKEVWIENPDDKSQNYKSAHWKEKNGKLRFDYGYPPEDGWVIRVIYRDQHAELTTYSDEINIGINTEWLKYAAAKALLDWGMGRYGAQAEYRIEERMGMVMERLKMLHPRSAGPDILIKTAGG